MHLNDMRKLKMRVRRVNVPLDKEFEVEVYGPATVEVGKVGQSTAGATYVYVVESWQERVVQTYGEQPLIPVGPLAIIGQPDDLDIEDTVPPEPPHVDDLLGIPAVLS